MRVADDTLAEIGANAGEIVAAEETERDFGSGPEPVVAITVQPDGDNVRPIEKTFNPDLSTYSGLGKFLTAIGAQLTPGKDFDLQSIVGTRVRFQVVMKDNGFIAAPNGSFKQE